MVAARAVAKQIGASQKRLKPIMDLVRGRKVNEALGMLELLTSPWAKVIAKTVKSAAANAENNLLLNPDTLCINHITADVARPLKRIKTHARGRIGRIRKKSCHITVVVNEEVD